ncbi:unnamed protein product [Clavelina lepadiformis]|uniref:Secreted protein n=1 Tax=Clavelina lepadiformis TaxID=159417 RepID=A0ABP0GLT6_CLALP
MQNIFPFKAVFFTVLCTSKNQRLELSKVTFAVQTKPAAFTDTFFCYESHSCVTVVKRHTIVTCQVRKILSIWLFKDKFRRKNPIRFHCEYYVYRAICLLIQ